MKNEIVPFLGKSMELEVIVLNKISQTQEDKYCVFISLER